VAPQYCTLKASRSTFYIVWHVAKQYTEDTLLRFHDNNGYTDVPQRFLTSTLPFLLDGSVLWPRNKILSKVTNVLDPFQPLDTINLQLTCVILCEITEELAFLKRINWREHLWIRSVAAKTEKKEGLWRWICLEGRHLLKYIKTGDGTLVYCYNKKISTNYLCIINLSNSLDGCQFVIYSHGNKMEIRVTEDSANVWQYDCFRRC